MHHLISTFTVKKSIVVQPNIDFVQSNIDFVQSNIDFVQSNIDFVQSNIDLVRCDFHFENSENGIGQLILFHYLLFTRSNRAYKISKDMGGGWGGGGFVANGSFPQFGNAFYEITVRLSVLLYSFKLKL